MTFIAIMVLMVKYPLMLIQAILKQRILLVICIVGIIALIAMNTVNKDNPTVEPVLVSVPDKSLAPDVWVTPSRHYYSISFREDAEMIYLEDYFTFNSEKWERVTPEIPLPLDKDTVKHFSR